DVPGRVPVGEGKDALRVVGGTSAAAPPEGVGGGRAGDVAVGVALQRDAEQGLRLPGGALAGEVDLAEAVVEEGRGPALLVRGHGAARVLGLEQADEPRGRIVGERAYDRGVEVHAVGRRLLGADVAVVVEIG